MGEPYKREYAEELANKHQLRSLSFYRSGNFLDMCEGPHVSQSDEIPEDSFKIKSIAGAYWRGDSKNVMMTRIYVWAFESKAALEREVENYQNALARDHKKIGKELEIFAIDDEIGKGLPLWLPHGTVIREELEKLMKETEFRYGYQRIATPQIAKSSLYRRTGHLPYYAESMYPAMELRDNSSTQVESYHLRPMNCPHHHQVFAIQKRSYRELPLRLAEYGHVFRYEDSGALSGLLRVRGMCQNDAHIYCSEEQVIPELKAVLQMYREVLSILGLEGVRYRLSRGKKNTNDDQLWNWAEGILQKVLEEEQLPYFAAEDEAAFYGPKIDIQLRTVTGREETASTIQLDISSSRRLGLKFVGSDNQEHYPFIIHRAPLGTHERTVAFLLEHYAGSLPLWLSPIQVKVVPVSDRFQEYAKQVVQVLRNSYVRAEADLLPDSLQKKIRSASMMKVAHIAVVGEREQATQSLSIRKRGQKTSHSISLVLFLNSLLREIQARSSGEFGLDLANYSSGI
jgi:threonyl-tRNA synthetase